jgi:hypothetical protein
MKLPRRLKTIHWMMIDLLAFALVAGFLRGLYATWTGEWSPIDTVMVPAWPLLAFAIWMGIALAVAVLIGCQYGSISAARTAESARTVEAPERPDVAASPAAAPIALKPAA